MNAESAPPVTAVSGVGDKSAAHLAKLGIQTVFDLINHVPFRYEDYEPRRVEDLTHDERATLIGRVQSEPSVRYFGKKKTRLTFRIETGGVLVTVTVFNRAFLKRQITQGALVTVSGKFDKHRLQLTAQQVYKGEPSESGKLAPVYSVTSDINMTQLKKWIQEGLKAYGEEVPELLPAPLLERYRLPTRAEALFEIHRPSSREALKHARRRIVYEEFFLFQLKLLAYKQYQRRGEDKTPLVFDRDQVDQFMASLPFTLTKAQHRVIQEVLQDMSSDLRMNRLLQGDVGSGKTLVALIAVYAAVTAGKQAALMVPTEILAEQHAEEAEKWLASFGVKCALLTGSMTAKEKRKRYEALEAHQLDLVIGTHALIQPDVPFHDLGLVITDEQHRFGVRQRRVLKEKGASPDVLFMTATPIPRTMSITSFGDMDVSSIDELPAGRKPIETYWAKPDMLERVVGFMKKELAAGRQAYVICPLIEESEQLDVQNAVDVHQMMQELLPTHQIGLMHGRLPAEEKEGVMASFAAGEAHVLVSTTVVEVGVNVPNATMMLIYDADRFGLAQLHQLRGRVGRGEHQSYCILLAEPSSENGQERMRIMTETNDGFVLSERDLELRGPGDFFGDKQSGLPDFQMADPVHDKRALETARADVAALTSSEEFWSAGAYPKLWAYLEDAGVFQEEKLD
ncbi:ATP-dependent DNA helicase RecG [Salsuginibacillus halophilus]|uniref:ATP-dependent DNA helicase RecG n=1 Tax=Salsuginibacillus halophilus TaxID=517424 RepID=A0A2P8HY59_9BACI|nr:ATP-dependent DNA helicase RecG [Salsuginibacillus halophilus]PSL51153.1 ATP-dependent DNA helicase RecG [Salsuginibacillus halophilus]